MLLFIAFAAAAGLMTLLHLGGCPPSCARGFWRLECRSIHCPVIIAVASVAAAIAALLDEKLRVAHQPCDFANT